MAVRFSHLRPLSFQPESTKSIRYRFGDHSCVNLRCTLRDVAEVNRQVAADIGKHRPLADTTLHGVAAENRAGVPENAIRVETDYTQVS